VDPRPAFWRCMRVLAETAAAGVSRLSLSGLVTVPGRVVSFPTAPVTAELAFLQQREVAALTNFASQMTVLEGMAEKELLQQPLDAGETEFLKSLIEDRGICHQGETGWTGWYAHLFYRNAFWSDGYSMFDSAQGCALQDFMVADVHTDVPEAILCDPG